MHVVFEKESFSREASTHHTQGPKQLLTSEKAEISILTVKRVTASLKPVRTVTKSILTSDVAIAQN